jgi:hypothetical protein
MTHESIKKTPEKGKPVRNRWHHKHLYEVYFFTGPKTVLLYETLAGLQRRLSELKNVRAVVALP